MILKMVMSVGGGLGVVYRDELPPQPSDYAKALLARLDNYQDLELIFEPGRAIAANAGVLLTRVEFLKHTEQKKGYRGKESKETHTGAAKARDETQSDTVRE